MSNKTQYKFITPRITAKVVDGDTDEILFEYSDRTWMNIGDVYLSRNITEFINNELSDINKHPNGGYVITVSEFERIK